MELLKHAGFQTDSPKKRAVLALFWILLGSLIWTKTLLYSQNFLFFNPYWSPYIPSLQNLHKGNIETLFGRSLVAGHHLRSLGSQERRVFTRHPYHPKEFAFTLRLKENSAVAFIFNHRGEEFSVLRLSSHPLRPSSFYQSNLNEVHINPVPLLLNIPTYRSVQVNVREVSSGIEITLDGKQSQTVSAKFENAYLGLEVMSGGEVWAPALIDQQGQSFSMPFQREEVSPKFFVLILVLFIFLMILFRRRLVTAAAFFSILGATWFTFDFFSYSHSNFAWQASELTTTDSGPFDVEKLRYRFFEKAYGFLGGETLTQEKITANGIPGLEENKIRYCTHQGCESLKETQFTAPSPQTLRIVVLGGSIGAGWGVTDYEKTYAEVLHQQLQKSFAGQYDVEVLNLSDSANSYRKRMPQKFEIIEKFQPNIILVELLFNFIDADAFIKALAKTGPDIAKFYLLPLINPYALSVSHLNSVRAGSAQNPVSGFKAIEEIKQIKILDPNPLMLSGPVLSGGKMFWDYYHPTNWGHAQLATYLAQEIKTQFVKDRPTVGP